MLNIALDPIFIKVLGMGVDGVAIATVISMVITTIITFVYFIRGSSELYYNLRGFKLDFSLTKRMAPIGVSGMVMQLAIVIQHLVIYRSIGIYGSGNEIALMGVTLNMLSFAIIPIWGISQGLQPVVGMNFGARKYPRIKGAYRKFVLIATGIVFFIWAVFMLFPRAILGLYSKLSSYCKAGHYFYSSNHHIAIFYRIDGNMDITAYFRYFNCTNYIHLNLA
jgi:Na+-driven multidrug efflux pump